MPRTENIKNSFVGGEISPNLLGRTDLAKYHSSCESISNFVIKVQGGAVRRPGTKYIVDAGGANRLIPFRVSNTLQYILEFGQGYIRFYTNDGQIQSSPGVPYQIVSPYALGELWDIHYAQQISILYLCHPNHPPQKLIRITDTNWQLVQPTFFAAPAIKQDQDVGTQKSASITITGSTVTASNPVFIAGDIGKAVVAGTGIGYISNVSGTTSTDGTTGATLFPIATIVITNPFDLVIYAIGSWFLRGSPTSYFSAGNYVNGTLHRWFGAHKFGFGTIVTVYATVTHPTDASWQTSINNTLVNIVYTDGFIDSFRTLDVGSYVPFSGGYCQIVTVVNSTQVKVKIINIPTVVEQDAYGGPLMAPAPPGSWSFETPAFVPGNYPSAVCFFGDRLFFAGTQGTTPNTFWGSGVGDYENFGLGTIDTAGVRYTINASSFDLIKWMTVYQGNIVMGGVENEYVVNGGTGQAVTSAGSPITPSNINVATQSSFGVSSVQAIRVDNDLLFIQKSKQKTYQFAYNAITSSYGSRNLNILNELITTAGIKEMVYQAQPSKVVWFTDLLGNLIGLTYDKEQDVWAWHRHFTGVDTSDQVISIASITVTDGTINELWMLCKRTRGGVIVYTIEIMDTTGTLNLDCASTLVSGSPVTSISGLAYLNGRPVTAVVDGTVLPTVIMTSSGIYTFPLSFSGFNVQVGISYISTLLTVRPEPRVTVQGLHKRWVKLFARLYQSLGLLINNQEVFFRDPGVLIGTATPLLTGDVQINNLGYDKNGRVTITQKYPLASSILSIFGVLEISDGV